ncbi:MAG TPA: lipocalin family protein [Methanocorpusculum sp.]|nr:lipocalin family protein [Methanocorpusculum sp.]
MKKVVLCILLVLAAVIFSAGCTDDGGKTVTPTTVPTVAPPAAVPTIEGTWYAEETVEYTDPTYEKKDAYDVALTFNKDNTGSEKWTSVNGAEKTPFDFSWMKNEDGSYTIFYTNGYPLSNQVYPSKVVTLSYDGNSLMDEDAHLYVRTVVHHTPGPTEIPTAVPRYYTEDIEKIRGDWKSTTIIEGPSDKPCRLEYDFNRDGSGVEIWICTERFGNQEPGPMLTTPFTWSQSTSGSMKGSYIVTVVKTKAGEKVTEVHQFSFIKPDFTELIDENGVIYLKNSK